MNLPPTLIERPYRVTNRRDIADGVFELTLEPIETGNALPLPKAGQWAYLHLLNTDGSVWARAAYSLANEPSDSGRVVFAIRIAGAFTERASLLKSGDEVRLSGPFGVFTPHTTMKRRVYIAGGIGVTPLRSMLLEQMSVDDGSRATLIYSARTPQEMAYHDEFLLLESSTDRFAYIPTCTRCAGAAWQGQCGRVNRDTLRGVDTNNAAFYLCGPRAFMDSMIELLHTMGVDSHYIFTERFS